MRFKEILREYSREKTANVFGKKLIAALLKDRGSSYGGGGFHAILSDLRNRIDQKQKIGSPLDAEQEDLTAKQILHAIEQGDPTPNKEYVQWLAKCYANEGIKLEDIVSKGADWLKTYAQLKVKRLLPPNVTNIMNLKFDQLPDVVLDNELLNKLQSAEDKTADKGKATTVFENGAVRIIVPHDETSACYYGQGTRWCTAAKSNNMYDNYARDGDLYILLPKQPKYDGEKYQLHFASGQFMDEGDSPISDMIALLTGRFGDDVMTFFFNKEPMIKQWIVVTPAEILQPLIDQIADITNDYINDKISDWEMEDDYYYNELREKGYVDEDGDVDWSRVEKDGMSWLETNDEAQEWLSRAQDAVRPSIEEVRDAAQELGADDGEECTLHRLDSLIARIVANAFRTRRGDVEDAGLVQWIVKHIAVRASTPSQQAAGDPQWKAEYFKGQ